MNQRTLQQFEQQRHDRAVNRKPTHRPNKQHSKGYFKLKKMKKDRSKTGQAFFKQCLEIHREKGFITKQEYQLLKT